MRRLGSSVAVFLTALVVVAVVGVVPVFAAGSTSGSPWWQVTSSVRPVNLPPGGEGTITVKAINLGDAPAVAPAKLIDVLPAGVTVVEKENALLKGLEIEPFVVPQISLYSFATGSLDLGSAGGLVLDKACELATGAVATVTCDMGRVAPIPSVTPADWPAVHPFEHLEMRIQVRAAGVVSGALNRAEVTGGGAPVGSSVRPVTVSGSPTPFGLEDFSLVPEEVGGGVEVRAGSHPFQLTATVALNQNADPASPPALPRNLQFRLPAGLIGNTTAVPQCNDLDFRALIPNSGTVNRCPTDTVVGVAVLTIDEPATLELTTLPVPLYNLVPGKGEPARFGFEVIGSPVTLDTSVRTGSDYGVTVSVNNITELASFLSSTVTFWGVPGDASHDESRGWGCLAQGHWGIPTGLSCTPSGQSHPPPFLTLPTSCAAPFVTGVTGDSWPTRSGAGPNVDPVSIPLPPAEYSLKDGFGRALGIAGCNELPFGPEIEVAPDVQSASTPTGLSVHVRVPQEVNQNAEGLASSSLKDITVTLPEGVTVNPSGAGGLEACAEGQIGFTGVQEFNPVSEPGSRTDLFTAGLPQPFCPDASKIGTVKIKLPVIANPLEGSVYLAAQNANPFGSLVAMYISAQDPVSGVLIKLAGQVHLSGSGQLVTTFENSPQGPLEEAEFHFFGGSRAPLSTPSRCGPYTTSASFVPWAAAGSGDVASASRTASSTFNITSGPDGGPCPGSSLPFSPSLTGGMTNINAGAFSPLTTTLGREDGNQDLQSVVLHMPPGLSGILGAVKLCPEAQANAGTCGPESLIGETTVSAGLGNEPVSVTGGRVYITEKYGGAPFGLAIVNPVKTGPFDLEHDTQNPSQQPACDCLVVRATIAVDPHTTALTVTTDASGPHAIPRMIDGVPVQIKHVNVLVNREHFTFNPTNCSRLALTGTLTGYEGASSPVSVPFQATNCATLKFAPKFSVSTSAKTSRSKGASLSVKLSEPKAPFGSQANIAKVKVDLPKQLPSRLTTLQRACTSAQFERNPAGCPKESKIGYAKVITPLLPVPVEGPAIFVSHGNEAFPSLTMVLQGYGVTVDLVGTTFISKAGITSTTFKAVPDVPFNTFELTLPEGKFSALAANGNLCKTKQLAMPTAFTAQNGLAIHQTTKIHVTGCKKTKKKTKTSKKHHPRNKTHKTHKKH